MQYPFTVSSAKNTRLCGVINVFNCVPFKIFSSLLKVVLIASLMFCQFCFSTDQVAVRGVPHISAKNN